MEKGTVYLVGAGPGDPKLITVYGMECIQKADVILYDRLSNEKLLQYAKKDAELIFCGKMPGKHEVVQEKINQLLVEKALEGKTVTRLKGGDPCVFGRVGEEAEVLVQEGISYEIVPGITSGIAAPAYAGIPVTHRDYASSFAIVTGHGRSEKGEDYINWAALAQGIDTIAFYMGVGNLKYICRKLIEHGKRPDTGAALIEWGTTEKQRTVTGTLETIESKAKAAQITHPAIVLVGDVVQLRPKLQWFKESRANTGDLVIDALEEAAIKN
ncbi:uroporphyrinogen-III C-methyltransferase [Ectobacillus funiculus]|uniref:uroporphyrinogen-III C-methyltransferase n=1 Tax=Ectobacillus funiculus TaxID=137993 RepID=UPI00397888F2